MKLGYLLGKPSGISIGACHFLVLRFDEKWGFNPDVGESLVMQNVGEVTHCLYGGRGWYTGLWRSPAGKVYISDAAERIHFNPDPAPRAAPWRVDPLAGTLTGIWGLDDQFVLTWGLRRKTTVMYRYNGSKWSEIESPGEVVGVHGISPDLVMAVGTQGLIARWDGKKWSRMVTPARGVLSAVHVASEDEMYAVGSKNGLYQGSVHGWAEVLEGPGPMFGITKWKGEIWVGAAQNGLMKLAGNKLDVIKANVKAEKLDARVDLLIGAPNMIVGTNDGARFIATQTPTIAEMLANMKPAWVDG